jgi:hypothetical protein
MSENWRAIPGNEQAFQRLCEVVKGGEAIAFVGAGASAGLYPLWAGLIGHLMDEAVSRGLATDADRISWRQMRGQRPQTVTRLIKAKLGEGIYRSVLGEIFAVRRGGDGKPYTPVHAKLMTLPLRAFVTTNFDSALLDARRDLRRDAGSTGWTTWKDDAVHSWITGDIFKTESCPILFAHGVHHRPDTIVLSIEEYRQAYRPGPWRHCFDRLWGQDKLIFIGFGFSDPWLDYLAGEVISETAARAVAAPRHLAIMGLKNEDGEPAESRRMVADQYDAEALFYPIAQRPDGGEDHAALQSILEALSSIVGTDLPAPRHAPAAQKGPLAPETARNLVGRNGYAGPAPATSMDAVPSALSAALPPVSYVPYPRNPNFTGRSEALAQLEKELRSGLPAAVTQAISGLGGVGKTQLAIEYAYRHASSYQVIWWIRAESPKTRLADLMALAKRLQLTRVDESDLSKVASVITQWLDQNSGWLLIFDNVVEGPAELERLLPKAGTGHVLITSQRAAWSARAKTVSLDEWTPEESTDYLLRRTGVDDTETNRRAARALADAVQQLPLALEQAAAYIEESKIGIHAYLELYKRYKIDLFKERPDLLEERSQREQTQSIATVWEVALRSIEQKSTMAVALLKLCAFIPTEQVLKSDIFNNCSNLPKPLNTLSSNSIALHDAIAALRRYSLIQATDESIWIHSLLALVVRDRLGSSERERFDRAATGLLYGRSNEFFTRSSGHGVRQPPLGGEQAPSDTLGIPHREPRTSSALSLIFGMRPVNNNVLAQPNICIVAPPGLEEERRYHTPLHNYSRQSCRNYVFGNWLGRLSPWSQTLTGVDPRRYQEVALCSVHSPRPLRASRGQR